MLLLDPERALVAPAAPGLVPVEPAAPGLVLVVSDVLAWELLASASVLAHQLTAAAPSIGLVAAEIGEATNATNRV